MGLLKRNLVMALGWFAVKSLAKVGLPYAKRKLHERSAQKKRKGLFSRRRKSVTAVS